MNLQDKITIVEEFFSTVLNSTTLDKKIKTTTKYGYQVLKKFEFNDMLMQFSIRELGKVENISELNYCLGSNYRIIDIYSQFLRGTKKQYHNLHEPYPDTLTATTSICELEQIIFEISLLNGEFVPPDIELKIIVMYVLYTKFLPLIPDQYILRIVFDYPNYFKNQKNFLEMLKDRL